MNFSNKQSLQQQFEKGNRAERFDFNRGGGTFADLNKSGSLRRAEGVVISLEQAVEHLMSRCFRIKNKIKLGAIFQLRVELTNVVFVLTNSRNCL